MVGAQNLQVPQLITHAQLVVGLKLVSMAGAADTLKVLAAVWIPCPQSPDKPCWHNVIHMPPRSSLPKIHAAQLDFAYSAESRDTVTPPAVPARGCTRPLTVNTFPTYRFLFRPEACLAKLAATIAIGFAAAMQNSEDFRLLIFAIGTKHGREPLSCFLQSDSGKNKTLRGPSGTDKEPHLIARARSRSGIGIFF